MNEVPDQFFQTALQNVEDGVYFCDEKRRIVYWNPAAEQITGFGIDDVKGRSCAESLLTHVDENGTPLCETNCPLTASLTDCQTREAKVYLHHKEGFRVPVTVRTFPICEEDGTVEGVVEVFTDNSSLAAALEKVEQLSIEADTDALTGVGNRRKLQAELGSCVNERRRSDGTVGLLFIDIDHFKQINDTCGHDTGDRVLKMVTETLRRNLRTSDTLARWGGDEFLAIVRNTQAAPLRVLAQKLRSLIASSYLTLEDGTELRVTASMGVTTIRPSDTDDSAIARVDKLLYESKSQGRDRLTWSE